jgi:hypothetical protein
MKKKIAGAALKYAAKEGGKNARNKVARGLERIARAVKANPGKRSRKDIADDGAAALDAMIREFIPKEPDGMLFARMAVAIGPKEARKLISRAARANGSRPGAYGVPEANYQGGQGRDPLAKGHAPRHPFFKSERKSRLSGREVLPNPYDQKGASFDLFGGESRALPKKVSEFHRPRVRVRGGTMTLAEGSPFKGRVVKLNPLPRIVTRPLRVTLTAAEAKEAMQGGDLPAFAAKVLKKAAQHSTEWDHIEARGPNGKHLFDIVP